jgi:flagellar hook-associated protein 3 FlgL
MRITDGMRDAEVRRSLSSLSARHAEASRRALTGRAVNSPSSDPVAAAELARNRITKAAADAGQDALTRSRGDLELAEGVLAEAGDLFHQAREIAMQGANGSLDASQRATLAKQVGQLKEHLVAIANTKGANGYVFAGSKTDTVPFSAAGAFSGDDVDHVVDLGSGTPTAVGASGARAFTSAGGRDVFADLDALAAALNANDASATSATLSGLDAAREQLMSVQAESGLRMARLDTSEAVMDRMSLALAQRDDAVAGADPYEAYTDMVSLSQSLEQAVAVARKVLDLGSLFRF